MIAHWPQLAICLCYGVGIGGSLIGFTLNGKVSPLVVSSFGAVINALILNAGHFWSGGAS